MVIKHFVTVYAWEIILSVIWVCNWIWKILITIGFTIIELNSMIKFSANNPRNLVYYSNSILIICIETCEMFGCRMLNIGGFHMEDILFLLRPVTKKHLFIRCVAAVINSWCGHCKPSLKTKLTSRHQKSIQKQCTQTKTVSDTRRYI